MINDYDTKCLFILSIILTAILTLRIENLNKNIFEVGEIIVKIIITAGIISGFEHEHSLKKISFIFPCHYIDVYLILLLS